MAALAVGVPALLLTAGPGPDGPLAAGALASAAALVTAVVAGAWPLGRRSGATIRPQSPGGVDFRALVEGSPHVTLVVGASGEVLYASPAVAAALQRRPERMAGRLLSEFVHPEDSHLLDVAGRGQDGHRRVDGARLADAEGAWVCFEVTITPAGPGGPGAAALSLQELRLRGREDTTPEAALPDPLTGLADRATFRDLVGRAMDGAAGGEHAVVVLDIDDFKAVNDSLGRAAGDEILAVVGDRLLSAVDPRDQVARLEGDQFAVLVQETTEHEALELARWVTEVVRQPVLVRGRRVGLSGSTGIAMSSQAEDADQLLRNADLAMHRAKAGNQARHALFRPEMHRAVVQRLNLQADLRRAIEADEIFLHYQPIVDLAGGGVSDVEVLARWDHPEHGRVRPDEFIPVAEDSGLIHPLGARVLRQACTQARAWHLAQPDRAPVGVCVNVSVRQLESDTFFDEVRSCLADSGLDPTTLTLEITESVYLSDFDSARERLQRLKSLGLRVAVDDFGTGHSSLSYLRLLPLDVVKIDRCFVDGVAAGPAQSAVARAVVGLARAFDLRTVAEGIERPEQAAELAAIGADMGQGFYFAPPVDAEVMTAMLQPDTCGGRRVPAAPGIRPPGAPRQASLGIQAGRVPS